MIYKINNILIICKVKGYLRELRNCKVGWNNLRSKSPGASSVPGDFYLANSSPDLPLVH
jgi:hypothetical protein